MSAPLVSVCMPARDQGRWLGEAIASALAQQGPELELIVVDDGSRDATREVLASCRDRRLRAARHDPPRGVARSRNACLALARGELVAWLDADDRWLPGLLAAQVAALESHPGAVVAHGAFHVIDEAGRRLPGWRPAFAEGGVESGTEAFRELTLANDLGAPTVVVRRSAYERAGGYDESLASAEDSEMWMRLALIGDFVYTARPLAEYRWHAESLTRTAAASGAQLARDLAALESVFAGPARALPDRERLERRARAAVAARALRGTADALSRRQPAAVLAGLGVVLRARPALLDEPAGRATIESALSGDEYGFHVAARALLGALVAEFAGSRLAARLASAARAEPEWEATLRRIAARVRRVVPAEGVVAAIDKWDPTLLHLSFRHGCHFPDRGRLAGGYPADDATAIEHLDELRRGGVDHLVVPCSAFWWLASYPEFAAHVESTAERVHADELCIVFRWARSAPPGAAGVGRAA